MDDLTGTQALSPNGHPPLKRAFEMRVTEIEFETRFAHLFLSDLPLPMPKNVSTFIYPTQQKRSSKRQAPAPPKSKLSELGGINNYHLRTIKDLGPILTQSARVLSNTSCSVNIVVNPLTSQRSPKLRNVCSDAKLDSNFKMHKKTPTPTKGGGTFRQFLRRNDTQIGDLTGDVSPSESYSYNFPAFQESAFERSCVDSREQMGNESHNSDLFYDYGENDGPKDDKGYSTVFSCLTSQVENTFFSFPPTRSPSVIQESRLGKQISSYLQGSPSQEQIQSSHALDSQTLVQNNISNIKGAFHLSCISSNVPQIFQHTQGILSPYVQESSDCIQDCLSRATYIPLSMPSVRVSKLETGKQTLNNSGSSNFDNEKLSQAENQLRNMETDPYYRMKQTSPLMCEEVDDGMSDSENVQSSPNLLAVMASNLSIYPQEDMHKIYCHEKIKDCSERKVPPLKPPRNRRKIFTFCEADVPSLIDQDSNCKKVQINNDDLSDNETPLKPPRNKCKVPSNVKKKLINPGDAGEIAFIDSKDLKYKQKHQVVEHLPPKRPERLHHRPVVGSGPQQRQSFRAKQHKTKKCRRKLSFPVRFSVSLKSSLDIFRMSRKHHTSNVLGERPCKNISIPFKSWLYPKSSAPNDFGNLRIPRIILNLEPSDVVGDNNLEVKTVMMNEQQHGKTFSSISSLVIPDTLSFDKDDLSTLGSLERIPCSQSSLHYENKLITSSQSCQHYEEHNEDTDFKNEHSSSEKIYMLPSLVSDDVIFMNAFRYEEKDY